MASAINAEYQRRADVMAGPIRNIGRTWNYLRRFRNAEGVLEERVEKKTGHRHSARNGRLSVCHQADGVDRVDFERRKNLDKKVAFEEDFAKPETQAQLKANQERAIQAENQRIADEAELDKYLERCCR